MMKNENNDIVNINIMFWKLLYEAISTHCWPSETIGIPLQNSLPFEADISSVLCFRLNQCFHLKKEIKEKKLW